jgi:type VI protein secretion system component VasF
VQTIDSVAVHTEDSKIKSTVIEKTKEVDMQSKGLPWYVYAILGAVIIVVFWIFIKRFIL